MAPVVAAMQLLFFMATYDLVIWFFNMVIHTFFRDIRLRGTFNIPKKGAIVFVIAPHHNQFVDPLVVMSTVKKTSGRQISLLTAATSYRKFFLGIAARLCSAIPVERAQDLVKPAPGTIMVENFDSANDNLTVVGTGTRFTRDAMPKGIVGLPNYLGNAIIDEVELDTRLRLRAPFKVNFSKPSERDSRIIERLKEGTKYVLAPHVNNQQVFQAVFDHLNADKALGIFPEGGLHDRPTLLPLKPGVAIMALGAVALSSDANHIVNVIPVGLNYFHAHKFRSRVVVEFGKPIQVTAEDGKRYKENNRPVVAELVELIQLRLKEVTVTCDDYDTLMAIQAARRLYTSANREQIPLPLVVEMNRRLMRGYQQYADRPDVRALKDAVSEYNNLLMRMELHDHQVEALSQSNRVAVFGQFLRKLSQMIVFLGLSMPGVVMFLPIFVVARLISRKKARQALLTSTVKIKAKDVIGTWKIIVALVLAPVIYSFWAAVATYILCGYAWMSSVPVWLMFVVCYGWGVFTTYASLRTGEIGIDYYKLLKPLLYLMLLHHMDLIQIEEIKQTRRNLAQQVLEFCDKYGPLMFDDYDKFYHDYHYSESSKSYGVEEVLRRNDISFTNLEDVAIFSLPDEERLLESGHSRDRSDFEKLDYLDGHVLDHEASESGALMRLRKAMRTKSEQWE